MSFEIKRARGKTAVYSGIRQHSEFVPRLEDLCIQKLLNNVNLIECVGDVPYYILKPVLTKISASQLDRIESYNPHLLEDGDSDEPWKMHCQRHFVSKVPIKNETWRDLYHRCEKERDHRIQKIAKKISKKHEKQAMPARQVRVVEQQPGGRGKAISTTVITKTIKHHHINPRTGGNDPNNCMPSTSTIVVRRETSASNGSQSKTKAKTAPLMQKSMQLFKSRFRR